MTLSDSSLLLQLRAPAALNGIMHTGKLDVPAANARDDNDHLPAFGIAAKATRHIGKLQTVGVGKEPLLFPELSPVDPADFHIEI